jgi:hypothetical protein
VAARPDRSPARWDCARFEPPETKDDPMPDDECVRIVPAGAKPKDDRGTWLCQPRFAPIVPGFSVAGGDPCAATASRGASSAPAG